MAAAGDRRSVKEIVYDASAGAAAGAIAATFVCPLDVIKTRFQVHGLPEMHPSGRKGVFADDCNLRHPCEPTEYFPERRSEGTLPRPYTNIGSITSKLGKGGKGQLTIASNMIAAAGAGAATAIATNPLWVVKTRLQTQGMRQDVVPYKNIFSALRRIVHEEGFRGWYSGLLPSLAGISHVAIQFPAYERIKFYLAKRDNKSSNELSPWEVAVASSFSKVVASISTYPHEVVRSRLQEQGQVRNSELQYTGVIDCIKKVFQKEGIPGFYRGCGTNLLRTTPSAVITFTSYEMIHRFLLHVSPPEEKHPEPHPQPDGGINSQKGTTSPGDNNTLDQSVNPSNDRTHFIPLGNTDKVAARH
ncbi:UNVERIFIED_CONTAM: Nicotinamide adenine dinucleotide transporter 2, mitochondrial [Sesamum calycinum]|uniref:Nicotinamide adenine dinucleotide transporter 2, mitochondrial n=1 Tax=Sesamum calycinum TaxID=2727403 RepID=A0AAW2JC97_9LAMI